MRIRKNAKNSAFLNTNPNSSRSDAADEYCQLQKQNLCQLNQSPWDVITFPSSDSSSSFHQHLQFDNNEAYYNVNLSGNGNSVDSIGDFDQSVASETSEFGENKKDCGEILLLGFKVEGESSDEKIQEEIKLCGKRDEKGWQCGNVVKYGNTMCDYHLSELQNDTVRTTKNKSGLGSGLMTTGTRQRCGRKKRPTTNPNDLYYYYYYSGFGPSWGKKRGTDLISKACNEVATTTTDRDSSTSTGNGVRGIDGDLDVKKEKGKRFKHEVSEVGPMESDYIDDDDDDDDDEDENGIINVGKKRVRKPIKERSLKSLM